MPLLVIIIIATPMAAVTHELWFVSHWFAIAFAAVIVCCALSAIVDWAQS